MSGAKRLGCIALGVAVAAGSVWLWKRGVQADREAYRSYHIGLIPVSFATTRGHVSDGEIVAGHTPYDYAIEGPVPGLSGEGQEVEDVFIVIHGLNNNEVKAVNRFGIAKESLARCGYRGTVVGFSWDGSTNFDPWGATGYREAKHNAIANGRRLAQFVHDLRRKLPKAKLRLLGYSMGARVALEALSALYEDPRFASVLDRLDSVHLVGASVKNEDVELGERFGVAIERRTDLLVNYYSPMDSKLGKYFPAMEFDKALGRTDIEHPDRRPRNYTSRNVAAELPGLDDQGNLDRTLERGRNHSGYLGSRNNAGVWVDDGAMNVVIEDVRG